MSRRIRETRVAIGIAALSATLSTAAAQVEPVRDQARVYDCGANALYVAVSALGQPVSYARAVELLPRTTQGNTLKEVRDAFITLGILAEGFALSSGELSQITGTAVVFWDRPEIRPDEPAHETGGALASRGEGGLPGHFLVIHGLDEHRVQLLDFPHEPVVMPRTEYLALLHAKGGSKIKTLLVGGGRAVESPVAPPSAMPMTERGTTPEVSAVSASPQGSKPSRVEVVAGLNPVRSVWSYGDVAEGTLVEREYVLTNRTDRPLSVREIRSSCGCMAVVQSKKSMAPGEDITVRLRMSLLNRYTRMSADAMVMFDRPDVVPVILGMTGVAHARWTASPSIVDYGNISTDSGVAERVIGLSPTKYAGPGRLQRAASSDHRLRVSLSGENQLKLVMDPKGLSGPFFAKVELFVQGEDSPALAVDVRASVEGFARAVPSQVYIGGGEGSVGGVATLGEFVIESAEKFVVDKLELAEEENGRVALEAVGPVAVNGTLWRQTVRLRFKGEEGQQPRQAGSVVVMVRLESRQDPVRLVVPYFRLGSRPGGVQPGE